MYEPQLMPVRWGFLQWVVVIRICLTPLRMGIQCLQVQMHCNCAMRLLPVKLKSPVGTGVWRIWQLQGHA